MSFIFPWAKDEIHVTNRLKGQAVDALRLLLGYELSVTTTTEVDAEITNAQTVKTRVAWRAPRWIEWLNARISKRASHGWHDEPHRESDGEERKSSQAGHPSLRVVD